MKGKIRNIQAAMLRAVLNRERIDSFEVIINFLKDR